MITEEDQKDLERLNFLVKEESFLTYLLPGAFMAALLFQLILLIFSRGEFKPDLYVLFYGSLGTFLIIWRLKDRRKNKSEINSLKQKLGLIK